MTTTVVPGASGAAAGHGRTSHGWATWVFAVAVLLALTTWAATAGPASEAEAEHAAPSSVEPVHGSDFSVVTLTPAGAEKVGLAHARVERTSHPAGKLAVPYTALVYGPDGTVWVYTSTDDPLRFRRQVVEVVAVDGLTAILGSGPEVGTTIAGTGSAELYGTEFEVGH